MLKYKYQETEEVKKLLLELEALKIVFGRIRALPHIEENLRRESLLKSALFSARVEGNPLTLEKIKFASRGEKSPDLKKLEVFNLLRAYRYVYSPKSPKKLNLSFIQKLHQETMKNISTQAGKWRTESWAIFNQAGVAIYSKIAKTSGVSPRMKRHSKHVEGVHKADQNTTGVSPCVVYLAPAPFRLLKLMQEYVQIKQNLKYEVPIKAAILQFLFEKIHPFADGNGRVGRLISTYIMNNGGYGFRGLVSMEEIIDKNRENYYQVLESSQDAALFVEFFLRSFVEQAGLILDGLGEKEEELPEDFLLPRRREILEIIKDHPYCTFDFISRRFPTVNPKTLHYDFKQLQEKGFIIKAGKTRGVTYKARE